MDPIEQNIRREAKRLILAQERRHRLHFEAQARLKVRAWPPYVLPPSDPPEWWSLHDGFNPYKTLSRVKGIARSINRKLLADAYVPRRPAERFIPKPDGTLRSVNVYQVADSAISKTMYESLLDKNLPMMSARSYAYRKDLNLQDAVRHIRSAFRNRSRMYVAEYDFSKYFEYIAHDHLWEILNGYLFVSGTERRVIDAFLQTPVVPDGTVYSEDGGTPRTCGIPQGTSISLFLANVAAWHLDRALEEHGVGFARYADDTLIWSADYGRIVGAADILADHAAAMGVKFNFDKSAGIRLLVADKVKGEIKTTDHVNYLGYSLRLGSTTWKEDNEKKIKDRIQKLIFETLIRAPKERTQNMVRVTKRLDLDYVVMIARLKRYLYGDLREREVQHFRRNGAPMRRFKGIMAAYPLVDDFVALRALDDWILAHLWLGLRKRGLFLEINFNLQTLPVPHGLTQDRLRVFTATSRTTGHKIDLRVPSVERIARVLHPDAPPRPAD